MIKLGIISPSEIALRRFMPAITANPNFDCIGYAINSIEERYQGQAVDEQEPQDMLANQQERVEAFVANYGGKIFTSNWPMSKTWLPLAIWERFVSTASTLVSLNGRPTTSVTIKKWAAVP